jgi:hypothetical protein
MRGLKRLRSTRVISAGHAFIQSLRRGHYELAWTTSTPDTGSPRPLPSSLSPSEPDVSSVERVLPPANATTPGDLTSYTTTRSARSTRLSHPLSSAPSMRRRQHDLRRPDVHTSLSWSMPRTGESSRGTPQIGPQDVVCVCERLVEVPVLHEDRRFYLTRQLHARPLSIWLIVPTN